MQKFTIDICPVCEGTKFKLFIICKDHFITDEQFEIMKCESCGLKFTANIESEEKADRYYQSEKYISHSNTSKGFTNLLYHAARKYMLGNKRRFAEKISGKKRGSILDIGAGTGFFLKEMANHGWRVSGTEKSENAKKFAKEKHNLHINTPLEIKTFAKQQFNIITLWHVLEHIYNPNEYIQQLIRLLRDDGVIIAALPNSDSYDAGYYKNFWAAYDVPRHIWHFGPKQIELFGAGQKLKLIKIKKMPLDSFYISILSEKYKGTKIPFLKGFFIGAISWFTSLFDYQKCSSLIYVFKKN